MSVIGFRKVQEELRSDLTLTLTSSMSTDIIQSRIEQLPRYLNSTLTIQFSDGTYVPSDGRTLYFGGFSGPGTLVIQGNPSESGLHTNQAVIFTLGLTHAMACFTVNGCSCPVLIKNIRFNRSATAGQFYAGIASNYCYDISALGCCFDSENQSGRGLIAQFSNVKFYNNYGGALQGLLYGYLCSGSLAWDNDDLSSSDRPTYGYVADHASVGYYGTVPSCTTAVATAVNGGRVWT